MAAKRKGLGKGLDALFPEKPKTASVSTKADSEKKKNTANEDIVNTTDSADLKTKSGDSKVKAESSEGSRSKSASSGTKKTKTADSKAANSKSANSKTENPAAEKAKTADFEENKDDISTTTPEILVKISKVSPNREQPRKHFDEDALLELSESIKQYGIIQPILVSNKKDFKGEEYYEIIAGERRWRAARMAGLKEVPVIIKEFSDQEIVEISLIENIQREDLNPIEEAQAYKRLMEEFHLKQDEVAEKVSRSRTAVANSTRLLKLDERVQEMLINDMISAGHARALLAIVDNEKQYEIAMKLFDEKLSVRETEILVKRLTEPVKPKKKPVNNLAEDAIYEGLEERLKGIVGTKVSIQRKRNHKGKIEIEYYSQDELERILDLFDSIRES